MISGGLMGVETDSGNTILNCASTKPIIIVDDSVDDRDLLLRLLRSCLPEEKTVIAMASGTELLEYLAYLERQIPEGEKFEMEMPEMIFLDLLMPDIDGIKTLSMVRSQAVWRDVPITLITNSKNNEAIERAENVGANAFLPKPFTSFDVIKTLNKANNFAPTLI